MNFIFQWNTV